MKTVTTKRAIVAGVGIAGLCLTLGACGGGTTISTSGGGNGTPNTATLPADWPSNVPTPTGLTLKSAVALNIESGRTWNASWAGPGDAGAVNTEMRSKFTANGWTTTNSLGEGTSSGGISTWQSGNLTTQLTVVKQENGDVAVNEGVVTKAGASPAAS